MEYIHTLPESFLLHSDRARELYRTVRDLPIFDYHCHLSPREIAENRPAESLGALWLANDHYKWRLMRAAGIEERLITGDAPYDEKFLAFAAAVPLAAGNPVWAWVKMELKAYFDIDTPLNPRTAPEILREANRQIAAGGFAPRDLMRRSCVETVVTTDDPADDLAYHRALRDEGFEIAVRPGFRPDVAVAGLRRDGFADYVRAMGATDLDSFLAALERGLDRFAAAGCTLTDLSLADLPAPGGTHAEAAAAFDRAMNGGPVSDADEQAYQWVVVRALAAMYASHDLVMQLHLAARRNNRRALWRTAGVDCGNDSVGAPITAAHLCALLDALDADGVLPRTIVYTLNPSSLYEIATMLGNFWHGGAGHLNLGAAWWFLDHVDGIEQQLRLQSATGLLGTFAGMLTDSRSFTSYPRHDYFRRILCNVVADWVEQGLYDEAEAPALLRAVSIENARSQFSPR